MAPLLKGMASTLAVLCAVLAVAAALSPAPPVKTKTETVGPFELDPTQKSFSVPRAPYPEDAGGILFWGNWVVRDVDTGHVVGEGECFLHHIMLFGKNAGSGRMLITGASDERATFGPQLHHPYYLDTTELTVAGSVLLVGYHQKRTVVIEYDIEYVEKSAMPPDARFAVSFSHAITIEVPQNDDRSVAEPLYKHSMSAYKMPQSGILLSMVGHLHVGGEAIRVFRDGEDGQSKELFCASVADHHYGVPCFIECPVTCRDGAPTWHALKSLTSCTDNYVYLPGGASLYLEASYHSDCHFKGCHAQSYHWYYPTGDPDDLILS